MSRNIDENVVQMKFDNAQFENNVKTTMNTLDKLKSALNFKGSETALDGLDSAAAKLNKNGLLNIGNSLDTVHAKFSALEVVGMTALSRITNSAMDAGKKIVDALTVNGQKEGFSEYEKIIDATKIIQASSPEYNLDQIKGYLDELNTYADKTIYSFSDMTDNIGKFTNAGVDLPDAVAAIQGIANAAALSGSTTAQASHAMYNFSQALSAGYVKLIDWKSIENANMATVEFKQQLIDTAVECGTLTKGIDGVYDVVNIVSKNNAPWLDATQNFNDSLAQQWMTTEVLTKTLAKYTDTTTEIGKKATKAATQITTYTKLIDTVKEAIGSGWSKSFELIFGDLEQATELWTNLNDNVFDPFISKMSETRNEALKIWRESPDGFKAVEHSVKELYNWVVQLGKAFSDNFNEVFHDSKSLDQILIDISKRFDKFATSLHSNTIVLDNITKLVRGIFDLISTGKNIIGGVFSIFKHLIESVYETLGGHGGLIGLIGDLGEGMSNVAKMLTKSEIDTFVASVNKKIDEVMPKLKPVLEFVVEGIKTVAGVIVALGNTIYDFVTGNKRSVSELTEEPKNGNGFINWLSGFAEKLEGATGKIQKVIEPFGEFLKGVWAAIKSLASDIVNMLTPVGEKLKSFGTKIKEAFNEFSASDSETKTKTLTKWGLGLFALYKIIDGLGDKRDVFEILLNPLKGIAESIQGLNDVLNKKELNEKLDIAKKFSQVVLAIAGALFIVSLIDTKRARDAVIQIGVIFGLMFGVLVLIEKITNTATHVETKMSTALSIFKKGKGGIGELLRQFVDGIKISLPDFKVIYEMNARATMIKALALALLAIAGALLIMDHTDLQKSIANAAILTTMLAVLSGLAYVLASSKMKSNLANDISTATQALGSLAVLVAGMYVIANVLEKMDGLEHAIKNAVILGSFAVALSFAARVMAGSKTKLLDEAKEYKSSGAQAMGGLLIICAGLYLIARALNKMDDLDNAVGNAVILGVLMMELGVISTSLIEATENTSAESLKATSKFLKSLAATTLSVSVVLLALDYIFSNGKHPIADMIGFGVICGALGLVTKALVSVSKDVNETKLMAVNKTLLAISESVAIMAGAIFIMSKSFGSDAMQNAFIIGGVVASAAALAGLAVVLQKFPVGINTVGLIAIAGAITIVAAAMWVLSEIPDMKQALIGLGAVTVALMALIVTCEAFSAGAALVTGVVAAVAAVVAAFGLLSAGIGFLLNGLANVLNSVENFANGLKTLASISKEDAQRIAENLVIVAEGFAKRFPEILKTVVTSLIDCISDIRVKLKERKADIREASKDLLISTVEGWEEAAPIIAEAIITILEKVIDVVKTIIPDLAEAVMEILIGIVNKLADHIGEWIDAGMRVVAEFIAGIADAISKYLPEINNSFAEIFNSIYEGLVGIFTDVFSTLGESVGEILGSIVDGFLQGIAESLKTLGTGLSEFMAAAMPFFDGLKTIDPSVVQSAKTVAETCLVFAEAEFVNGISSILSFFTGGTNKLTTALTSFADGIRAFTDKIQGIQNSQGDIDTTMNLIKLLKSAATENDGKNLTAFGEGVEDLGKAIGKFLKYLKEQGVTDIDSYTRNFLKIFIKVAEEKKVDFEKSGRELFEQVLVGGKSVNPEDTCRYFINVVVNKLKSDESIKKFYNAGKNAVQGFANGMSENSSIATKAAEKVARDALESAKKKLDEHSPSKEFYQVGYYGVKGLVNALNDGSSLAYNASENMAGSAIDGLKSTISRIADYIQNGLGDESLTITPVLDLSNINAGFRSINSMFSHDQAMSISANGVNGNSINGTTLNQILEALNAFNGFNVVMDTGATVGALAPTMNSALGQISYREARR